MVRDPNGHNHRRRRALGAASALACAAVAGGCAAIPEPATDRARQMESLWQLFFWAGLAVVVLVYGLFLFVMVRDRRRRGDDSTPPRQTRENAKLEVAYTIVPFVVVVVLFVFTFATESRVDSTAAKADLAVKVTAFDWSWRFDYAGKDVSVVGTPQAPPTLVLPVGRVVHFDLRSVDVDHSFYVPAFLFKRDAIPGVHNSFEVRLERVGTFPGQCAEFCGLQHAFMRFDVKVVSATEFDTWLRQQAAAAEQEGAGQ